jgi:hypothetical protein
LPKFQIAEKKVMNRIRLAAASIMLGAILVLGATPSFAARALVTDTLPHATLMGQRDQQTGKVVVAAALPVPGQHSVEIEETVHLRNVPGFCLFCSVHNTDYFIRRRLSASWVDGLHRWILSDPDGTWYAFDTGSRVGSRLRGKPSYDVGQRTATMGANDSQSLASVGDGGVANGGRLLNATYSCAHSESLNNVTYTMMIPVATTYVGNQQASFAKINGQLWSVDGGGHVAFHSERPWSDGGQRDALWSPDDRTSGDYPSVAADATSMSGQFRTLLIVRTYVHDEEFQQVRYTIQTSVQAELVQLDLGASAYMAWIDRWEYSVAVGSSDVERLSTMPVVDLHGRSYAMAGDRASAPVVVDVSDSSPVRVTLRYVFAHRDTYVVREYYVDRVADASYNQNLNLWVVDIDGLDYAIGFDGDNTSSWSGNVVRAPERFSRPQYAVPRSGGAVVPGRPDYESPEPEARQRGNSCIKGVDPDCGYDAPAPTTPAGNSCIKGVDPGC